MLCDKDIIVDLDRIVDNIAVFEVVHCNYFLFVSPQELVIEIDAVFCGDEQMMSALSNRYVLCVGSCE